jgi:hypothetical protein
VLPRLHGVGPGVRPRQCPTSTRRASLCGASAEVTPGLLAHEGGKIAVGDEGAVSIDHGLDLPPHFLDDVRQERATSS